MKHFILLTTLLAACTDQAAPTSNTVAEVRLENGNVVTFIDTGDGSFAIDQDYPINVQPVQIDNMTAVGVYRAIAPGKEIPAALNALQLASDEARASRPPATATKPIPWIDNTTIDDKWFVDTYCGGTGWDANFCSYNRTTGYHAWYSDTDQFYAATCADRGDVRLHTAHDGSNFYYDVIQGHCHAYGWTSGWLNEYAHVYVENVAGSDRYHVTAKFKD